MEKRCRNIFVKTGKRKRIAVWICAIILTGCLAALTGCSATKESSENGIEPLATEPLPGDYSVLLGNITIALYEDKQDITDKLDESGLNYNEYGSEMKYHDSAYNKYDSYYMIGESPLGTDPSLWDDASLAVYFEDGRCVRLSLLKEEVQTARGMRKGDPYAQFIEQYGDAFEKNTYAAHGVYDVYRYSYDDHICEFAVLADNPDFIQSVDIYVPNLYPIYDYGEKVEAYLRRGGKAFAWI